MFDTDEEIITALLAREEAAFREVIRRYQPTMLTVARSITGEAIADEVVQEAWVSVLGSLQKFERRSSLKTWILRIVSNEAKTRMRRENRHVSLEAMTAGDTEFAERFDQRGHWLGAGSLPEWGADSPEGLLSGTQLQACLERLMKVLPEMQAATLQLREQQGYSLAEICNILDVSESNVRVLLHRAKTRTMATIEHFQQTGNCRVND